MSQFELQGMMENLTQKESMEMQQQMVQKQQEYSANKTLGKFTNEEIIKAFKEFVKLKAEMDEECKNMNLNDHSEEARMQFYSKLEINKYMIEDYLSNLYDLDFSQLMMLINSRYLFDNPGISADFQILMQEFKNQAQ